MCTMRMSQRGRLSTERSRSMFGVTQLAGSQARNGSQCMLTVTLYPHRLLPRRFSEDATCSLEGKLEVNQEGSVRNSTTQQQTHNPT